MHPKQKVGPFLFCQQFVILLYDMGHFLRRNQLFCAFVSSYFDGMKGTQIQIRVYAHCIVSVEYFHTQTLSSSFHKNIFWVTDLIQVSFCKTFHRVKISTVCSILFIHEFSILKGKEIYLDSLIRILLRISILSQPQCEPIFFKADQCQPHEIFQQRPGWCQVVNCVKTKPRLAGNFLWRNQTWFCVGVSNRRRLPFMGLAFIHF